MEGADAATAALLDDIKPPVVDSNQLPPGSNTRRSRGSRGSMGSGRGSADRSGFGRMKQGGSTSNSNTHSHQNTHSMSGPSSLGHSQSSHGTMAPSQQWSGIPQIQQQQV